MSDNGSKKFYDTNHGKRDRYLQARVRPSFYDTENRYGSGGSKYTDRQSRGRSRTQNTEHERASRHQQEQYRPLSNVERNSEMESISGSKIERGKIQRLVHAFVDTKMNQVQVQEKEIEELNEKDKETCNKMVDQFKLSGKFDHFRRNCFEQGQSSVSSVRFESSSHV